MTRSYKGKEIAPVNLGFIKIDRATYEVLKFIKEKLKIKASKKQ